MVAKVTTYDQIGAKEDVSKIISNIDPTETPFQSVIGSENMKAIKHSWQEDRLDPPSQNAAIEGADAPSAQFTPTLMRENNTQILTKTVSTAGTADKVELYGRVSEAANQAAKKSAEIKRDLEYAFVGTHNTQVLGDNVSTPRLMATAWTMIDTSLLFNPDGTAFSGSTAASLSEAAVLAANSALYVSGGEASVLMIKPLDSLKIAAFASAAGRQRYLDGGTKSIVNVINVYVSPFGDQKVVMNRWQKTSDAFLFNPSMWKKLVLRPWFRKNLAEIGDSKQMELIGEYSLKHRNFKASAAIGNLS
jgi:hypothetical protein